MMTAIALLGLAATASGAGLLMWQDRADSNRPLVWLGTAFMIVGAAVLTVPVGTLYFSN
jgi:hypothetical protein